MENLITRAKQVILQPKQAWETIKSEEESIAGILTTYVVPLALIPAVASFIGYGLIGANVPFMGRMHSIQWGLNQGITQFIGTIFGILISGWVIQILATSFKADVSLNNAVKMVAYSYTPMLVAGVFYILPALSILTLIAGIYSLYVLYIGFKPITNVPDDKTTAYYVVSLLVIIGVSIVLSLVLAAVLGVFGLSAMKF